MYVVVKVVQKKVIKIKYRNRKMKIIVSVLKVTTATLTTTMTTNITKNHEMAVYSVYCMSMCVSHCIRVCMYYLYGCKVERIALTTILCKKKFCK